MIASLGNRLRIRECDVITATAVADFVPKVDNISETKVLYMALVTEDFAVK